MTLKNTGMQSVQPPQGNKKQNKNSSRVECDFVLNSASGSVKPAGDKASTLKFLNHENANAYADCRAVKKHLYKKKSGFKIKFLSEAGPSYSYNPTIVAESSYKKKKSKKVDIIDWKLKEKARKQSFDSNRMLKNNREELTPQEMDYFRVNSHPNWERGVVPVRYRSENSDPRVFNAESMEDLNPFWEFAETYDGSSEDIGPSDEDWRKMDLVLDEILSTVKLDGGVSCCWTSFDECVDSPREWP